MPFSTQCLKCRKIQEPYIVKESNKVYCSECNEEIDNLTYFVKVQMKSLSQYKRKSRISFAVKCSNCGLESRPKLIDDDIVCGKCKKSLTNLSIIFRNMLKDKLKNVGKDI